MTRQLLTHQSTGSSASFLQEKSARLSVQCQNKTVTRSFKLKRTIILTSDGCSETQRGNTEIWEPDLLSGSEICERETIKRFKLFFFKKKKRKSWGAVTLQSADEGAVGLCLTLLFYYNIIGFQ